MKLRMKPKVYKDKNGVKIKSGDILYRKIFMRKYERPGHKRVVSNSMSGLESIIPDEGKLLAPEEHWVTYQVGWVGACMVIEQYKCSDYQGLMNHPTFDENGERIFESSGIINMNNCFDGSVYEIKNL